MVRVLGFSNHDGVYLQKHFRNSKVDENEIGSVFYKIYIKDTLTISEEYHRANMSLVPVDCY